MKFSRAGRRGLGFTLMELMVVVAILAILAAILIPSAQRALRSSRRARGASNMRQIAVAFIHYCNGYSGESRTVPPPTGADAAWPTYHWARTLAQAGVLNEAAVYLWNDDSYLKKMAGGELPKVVIDASGNMSAGADAAWFHASVVTLAGVNPDSNTSPEMIPIAYTRGLNTTTGRWDAVTGVYGDEGGFIAFFDGHVEWFEYTTDRLLTPEGVPTSDPQLAAGIGSGSSTGSGGGGSGSGGGSGGGGGENEVTLGEEDTNETPEDNGGILVKPGPDSYTWQIWDPYNNTWVDGTYVYDPLGAYVVAAVVKNPNTELNETIAYVGTYVLNDPSNLYGGGVWTWAIREP
ncbi:MAG: prepilin-type N-terminal cleavage/methylation domain-containing protein [Puniceicoccales bacterium]|jgi:prepilin-type N-terminal cleavage/methylation domain-containing protein|nr:prepilin-type N-terminal cleavage/methylation domain-containing protein [Puniceicoccales bacterium]